jgi:hypothetical protein
VSTREEIIAGLRELADWLDANPEVPARDVEMRWSVSAFYSDDDDDGMAELRRLAALIGAEVVDTYNGTHFDATRRFRGDVRYEAGCILRRAMAEHDAVQRLGLEALKAQRAEGGSDA